MVLLALRLSVVACVVWIGKKLREMEKCLNLEIEFWIMCSILLKFAFKIICLGIELN